MASPSPAYNAALRRAREITRRNGNISVGRLRMIFRATAARAQEIAGGSSSAYQAARAESIRAQVLETLHRTEVEARAAILRHRDLTVEDIVRIHRNTVRSIAADAGVSAVTVATSFSNMQARTLAVLAARGSNAANFKTLVNRHMTEAADALDAIIDGGIGTGVSANTLAKDIASLILGEEIDTGAYGLDPSDLSGLKTIWYDSRRIAVSEINNAYRESNNQALQVSGIVEAARWQLSGRHYIEDECDDLAAGSSDGLLEGFYYLDEWPEAPHPFCLCGQGEVLLAPVEEWFDGAVQEQDQEALAEEGG
jgi:DNA-binding transcriptional regulator YhcF (GntR family)